MLLFLETAVIEEILVGMSSREASSSLMPALGMKCPLPEVDPLASGVES